MFQTTNQEFYSAFSSICQHNTYNTHSSNQVPQWSPRGKWRRPFRPSGVLQKDVDGFVGDGQEERIRIRRGGRNLHRATWRCETFRMESQMYVGLRWTYYGYILLYAYICITYIYIYVYLYDWNMDICIYIYIYQLWWFGSYYGNSIHGLILGLWFEVDWLSIINMVFYTDISLDLDGFMAITQLTRMTWIVIESY